MNKKLLTLCAVFVLSLAGVVCSCGGNSGPSLEDRGYTMVITYDCNGGKIGEYETKKLSYLPNSPLLEPGVTNPQKFEAPTLAGYYVEGWYTAEYAEDGSVLRDEEGNVRFKEKWDFSTVASDSMTLYANWRKLCSVVFVGGENGEDYVISNLRAGEPVQRPITWEPVFDGKTFYDYYDGEGETAQKIVWPIVPTEDEPEIRIHIKWLDGIWNIVRTSEDLNRMAFSVNGNFYLDNDVDFMAEGKPGVWKIGGGAFTGILQGNGHEIRNFVVERASNGDSFGLFSEIDGGQVKDVNFVNGKVQVDVQSRSTAYVGWLTGFIRNGASVSGCSFTDCTLSVTQTLGNARIVIDEENYGGIVSPMSEEGFAFDAPGASVVIEKKFEEKGVSI